MGKRFSRHPAHGAWHGVFHHALCPQMVWGLDKGIMETQYSKSSIKFLASLIVKERLKIIAKIDDFALNPDAYKNNIKKLQGSSSYRLRIGDYRVIFDKNGNILYIMKIGLRGHIYE
jgi:mRNA interferase RelE/StbE